MWPSCSDLATTARGVRGLRTPRRAAGAGSSRCAAPRSSAGFSLIEMLVVVACLGMIFWISAQLLFPMRTASERQRLQVESRQTTRAASDYMTSVLRGVTDSTPEVQTMPRNPLGVMAWVVTGVQAGPTVPACPGGTGCRQLSYNNVTGNLADPGTDIITVGQFAEAVSMDASWWPGNNSTTGAFWFFEHGCLAHAPHTLPTGDDTANKILFARLTGTDPASPGTSKLMVAYDESGDWAFYRITDYTFGSGVNAATCSAPDSSCQRSGDATPCIQVVAHPDVAAFNAPGGSNALSGKVSLTTGVRFMSYRVCNGWLQQREGLPDFGTTDANCVPGGDGNTPPWTSLLPNVEDMQIAYVFNNGEVMNTAQQQLATTVSTCDTSAGVPCQGMHGMAAPYDVTRVVGFRVTIVGRSATDLSGRLPTDPAVTGNQPGREQANQRLRSAEDHVFPSNQPLDSFRRHVVSANALIRNRVNEM